MPKIHCKKCDSSISSEWHYKFHEPKCNGQKPWRKRTPTDGKCKYCGAQYTSKTLGAHVVSCGLNPKRNDWRNNIAKSQVGKLLSKDHKEKLSRRIQEKVQEGTWHLSFSKSRTHEYKGIKLHGMWEVKYAKFLDEQEIKWRRPTEKFKYSFESKDSYYTPDFFLIEQNLYIEIKGYKVLRDEAKWSQFPLNLKVITGKDLIELGLLENKEVKDIPT